MAHAEEIISGLFLGNRHASHDMDFLTKNQIGLIVNCTKSLPFQTSIKTIETLRVPVDDILDPKDSIVLLSWMPHILQVLSTALLSRKRVLVHCRQGRQRSATVVACYLMLVNNWGVKQSIVFVNRKRQVAFRPKVNFHYTLQNFYAQINSV